MKAEDFFKTVDAINNVYRAGMGLEPLPKPETCGCGKPATYLGMCNGCYESAKISSREEHSAVRSDDDC